ncbi:hypothetical protein HPB49_020041 [Dermacentor silvarum]|uniref:Uncharacterized protein n=1 Tax=Dermacentor silvarum TaxID=543639 RepID=A0ACB8CMM3_DERSI|nr:hypothetical protein HPB49_020041 [Dermacentor silvarum]
MDVPIAEGEHDEARPSKKRAVTYEQDSLPGRVKSEIREMFSALSDSVRQLAEKVSQIQSEMAFQAEILLNKTGEPWYEVQAISTSPHGILYDVLFMLVFGGVLFLYLLYRVSGGCSLGLQRTLPPGKAAMPEDEDVAAEWIAVETICENGKFGERTLVARRLHKSFGVLQAVKELSFALRPAECFGLLGVNGAGKSTTFRMLTGLAQMTYGEAFMRDAVLSQDPRKWQSRIGYCPQGNALLGKLTAYESLYLFGRLRGVPEESLPDAVKNVIDTTDLREYAAKRCEYYSHVKDKIPSFSNAFVLERQCVLER